MDNQPIDQQPTEQSINPQNNPQPQFNAPEPTPVAPSEPANPPTFPSEPDPIQSPKKPKKKLIIILIIIAILLIGGGVAGAIFLMPKKESISQNDTNTLKPTGSTNVNSQLSKSYKDTELLVSFLAPDYHQTSDGYSRLFTANDYFIIFCRGGEKKEMLLSEINDYNFQTFEYSIGTKIAVGRAQTMTTLSSKEMTINGIDTLRFEGSIHYLQSFNNTETDNYVMGYNFFVKGIPVQLLGVSTDADKKPDTAESIKKDLDAMMQTLKIAA